MRKESYDFSIFIEYSTEQKGSRTYVHHDGDIACLIRDGKRKKAVNDSGISKTQLNRVNSIKQPCNFRGKNRKVNNYRYGVFRTSKQSGGDNIVNGKLAVVLETDHGDFIYVVYKDESDKLAASMTYSDEKLTFGGV